MTRTLSFALALAAMLLLAPQAPASPDPQTAPRVWTCFKSASPSSWTGQTSFSATTPTLLLRKAAGATRTQFRRLDISQTGTVAGGLITCVIKLDSTDRYSSGGNAWLIRAKDLTLTSASQPTFTIFDSATATAESSNVRTIFEGTIFQTVTSLGTGFIYDFPTDDGLPATGSILIYLYASSTGPTFQGTLTVYE